MADHRFAVALDFDHGDGLIGRFQRHSCQPQGKFILRSLKQFVYLRVAGLPCSALAFAGMSASSEKSLSQIVHGSHRKLKRAQVANDHTSDIE